MTNEDLDVFEASATACRDADFYLQITKTRGSKLRDVRPVANFLLHAPHVVLALVAEVRRLRAEVVAEHEVRCADCRTYAGVQAHNRESAR